MPRGRFAAIVAALAFGAAAAHAQLAIDPPNPTPLDTVRLLYTHTGCTDPDSMQVSQDANRITVQVDRRFVVDCGTVQGFFESFTLGRLPTGDYDASLVVNPPPGTLGPSQIVGPIHLSVGRLAPTGTAHPHENYTDMWWNPLESGWALTVNQFAEKLFLVWVTYDDAGKPTWFVLPGGAWSRQPDGRLHFGGTIYRTSGTPWTLPFDPLAVNVVPAGTADFSPLDPNRAVFTYLIDGTEGSKSLTRFRF